MNLRRDDILAAARRVFLRERYANASMENIAEEAKVSKQTVYNHFGSKEELFRSLIRERCQSLNAALDDETARHGEDPEKVLSGFGLSVLGVMLSEETLDLYRLLQAEARHHPELADTFYRRGPDHTAERLADYLAEETRRGRLNVPEPRLAAEQFVSMLVGHLRLRNVLGLAEPPSSAERTRYVASAVQLFLSGVRPR